tara:strand:+ start:125 stop:490 length:366 start_codon:yes stop_codon:yes gene_type:complete
MTVQRLSFASFVSLLNQNTKDNSTCVIKFYSNGCSYCHRLKDAYDQISDEYKDLKFFAFNIDGVENISSFIHINGVPSISLIKPGHEKPQISILEDPPEPNPFTWYRPAYIRAFIERETNE